MSKWTVVGGLVGLMLSLAGCSDKKSEGCGTSCKCSASASCDGDLVCDPGSGKCRAAATCADVGCITHQLCQEAASKTDAACLGQCETGFYWNNAAGTCDVDPPSCLAGATNSILALCDAQNRECVTGTGGDSCGACKATAVDVGGTCELIVTCASLGCAAQHRGCDEAPNGHCTDCVTGYVDDLGTCRLPLKCTDITCPDYCVAPATPTDAYCVTGGCGPTAILGTDGICHGCPACDDATKGEAGPYLTELTGEGRCICTTASGYFWREGLFPGVTPCDADQDGWVRGSAKSAIESSSSAVSTNARCDLKTIDRYVLESESGATKEILIAGAAVGLYETDRNDDQALVDKAVADGDLPAYGASGRPLLAKELNSLTKACVTGQADFNENGLADVNEWQTNPLTGSVQPYLKPFIDYAYFMELFRAWYAGGAYHIKEKSRSASAAAGTGIAVGYGGGDDYWRTCTRYQDSLYLPRAGDGKSLQGLDFARAGANGAWPGMNHHSQFKCIRVVDVGSPQDPPHWLTRTALDAAGEGYVANRCSAVGASNPPVVGAINPWDATLECETATPAQLGNGEVVLAAARYATYAHQGEYIRGCVNECREFPDQCPGYNSDTRFNTSQCVGDVAAFGKLICGCGYNNAGVSCELGCPGVVDDNLGPVAADPQAPHTPYAVSNLFLEWPYGLTPRAGYWLCGKPSVTAYEDGAPPWLGDPAAADPAQRYVVQGEIPMMHPASGTLTASPADCVLGNCYSIR